MSGILGAVLAGGRSSRFGSDKASAIFRGKPLAEWMTDALLAWTTSTVICGREGGLADRPRPDLGPLGGLNAALHFARGAGFDAVLSVPCDAPLLPAQAFAALCEAGGAAYVEQLPVMGLWPSALADTLDRHLDGTDRSMRGWAARIGAVPVRLDRPIVNVNYKDDLLRLDDDLGET